MKTLYPFQVAGVKEIVQRFTNARGVILADEMGLGKTVQVAHALSSRKMSGKRVLVVAPGSVTYSWAEELENAGVVATVYPEVSTITVVSYSMLAHVGDLEVDVIVLDEAHFVKERKSERTRWVIALAFRNPEAFLILVTGTPITARPADLWPMLYMLDPQRWGPWKHGWLNYARRYCGGKEVYIAARTKILDTRGASNLEELSAELSPWLVRRLKRDVLPDLPVKTRQVVVMSATGGEAAELRHWNEFAPLEDLEKIPELMLARHMTALRKADRACEHVLQTLDSQEFLVVFAVHLDVLRKLNAKLSRKVSTVVVTASMTPQERHEAAQRFQAGECRVFLSTIKVAGTGVTLTRADMMQFAELEWNPSDMNQAEDRIHRIGQRHPVLYQYIVTEGSTDAHVARMLSKKQNVIDTILEE